MNIPVRISLRLITLLFASLAVFVSSPLHAGGHEQANTEQTEQASTDDAVKAVITEQFLSSRPELKIQSIMPSPVPSMYKVQFVGGPTVYATADGSYFVLGDLFEVVKGGFVNLAEKEREGERAALMNQVKLENMIVFAPKDQPSKAVINVFTDVDCYYCQLLHQNIEDINRVGIEVRYLGFPRAGIGSEAYKKIASAWCSEDPQDAITKLKNRQSIPMAVCDTNPIASQYDLGQQVGVNGTPALLTAEGRMMPGYMPTTRLAAALGVEIEPALLEELTAKEQRNSQR